VWHGWHYEHRQQCWHRECEAETRPECARRLRALHPRPRSNLHLALTQGGYPQWVPPHPDGDGVRRDTR